MPREEWQAYEHEKEGLYRELSRGRLTLVAGLPALLDRLDRRGIALALATSAPELNVAHTLNEVGLAVGLSHHRAWRPGAAWQAGARCVHRGEPAAGGAAG